MFQIMHDFWIQCFPMWQNTFEAGYYILDFLTVMIFFRFLIDSLEIMGVKHR